MAPSDRKNYLEPFQAEEDLVTTIKDVLMLICERDLADKLSAASVPAARTTDIDYTDLGTAKKLIEGRKGMQDAMVKSNGMGYNTMILDRITYNALRAHPDIIGNFFSQNISGQVTPTEEQVRQFFEVDRLLIADGFSTSTAKREAIKNRIWGTNIYFAWIAPSKGRKQSTLGYNHNYGTMQDYVIRRESYSNPMNEDYFVYSNWNFDLVDLNCLGKFTSSNI